MMDLECVSNENQGVGDAVNVQLLMSPSTKCLPLAPSAPKLKYSIQNAFIEFFMCVFAEILNLIRGIFRSCMFISRSKTEPKNRDKTGTLS